MANQQTWRKVNVFMESAKEAAIEIDDILNGATATVSHSGADPTDLEIARLINIQGMVEVNNRIFRVANQASGTFVLEGLNTTTFGDYNTTSKGSFEIVTLGTSFDLFINFDGSGGEAQTIDGTLLVDEQDVELPGNKSAVSYSGSAAWDPADAGFQAAEIADSDEINRVFMVQWPSGYRHLFNGRVSFSGVPTGQIGDRVVTPFSVRALGKGTNYTS